MQRIEKLPASTRPAVAEIARREWDMATAHSEQHDWQMLPESTQHFLTDVVAHRFLEYLNTAVEHGAAQLVTMRRGNTAVPCVWIELGPAVELDPNAQVHSETVRKARAE